MKFPFPPPNPQAQAELTARSQERAEQEAAASQHEQMNDDVLVASVNGISRYGWSEEPGNGRLVEFGFSWAEFMQHLKSLSEQAAGFQKGALPIKLDAAAVASNPAAQALLSALRDDLRQLRSIAARAFSRPEDVEVRLSCTVPNGTEHFELSNVDPQDGFVLSLQDVGSAVISELLHVSRMHRCQGLWLFGNDLVDSRIAYIEFANLKDLRVLDLSENRISAMPRGLEKCVELEQLSLRGNPIDSLGPLQTFSNLRLLDLRRTALGEDELLEARRVLPGCSIRTDQVRVDR